MNITIDPINRTDIPFCEHEACFLTPTYGITVREMITGTQTFTATCAEHVRDMLPSFENAA